MLNNDFGKGNLTRRHKEILPLLAQGLGDKMIADRLGVAPGTIKNFNSQIYWNLGVYNRVGAVAKYYNIQIQEEL